VLPMPADRRPLLYRLFDQARVLLLDTRGQDMRRFIFWLAVVLIAAIGVIQLVPYGRDHTNPPVTQEPAWDRPETRMLAVRACFDCHSNETVWPWYSNVAPMSWLIQRDVDEGRRKLNYSEWNRGQKEARESAKTVNKREMPPWFYALPGTSARLTPAERSTLVTGLQATFGAERTSADYRQKKNDE
jgi:heme-binding protein